MLVLTDKGSSTLTFLWNPTPAWAEIEKFASERTSASRRRLAWASYQQRTAGVDHGHHPLEPRHRPASYMPSFLHLDLDECDEGHRDVLLSISSIPDDNLADSSWTSSHAAGRSTLKSGFQLITWKSTAIPTQHGGVISTSLGVSSKHHSLLLIRCINSACCRARPSAVSSPTFSPR